MKRIVLCLDGTNNLPVGGRTNVVRLFRMLHQADGVQIKYYQPGVGTLAPVGVYSRVSLLALKLLDSATAWMLERHVCSAYRFLMAHYVEGDEICVFGFSRGAYTARVLCGMLELVGLLHAGLEEMLPFAWKTYAKERDYQQIGRFRKTFCREPGVRFLGLWDTVSSVGTPWRPKVFRHTARNPGVACVRHAVALDERRALYAQNLWSCNNPNQDIVQLAFPGVHSDVGGGYPEHDGEHGLALIALAWMLREAKLAGIAFDALEERGFLDTPNLASEATSSLASVSTAHAGAPAHESLRGGWRWIEWLPLPRWRLNDEGEYERRWHCHRGRSRRFHESVQYHESIRQRMACVEGYRPDNLPERTRFAD